MNLEKQKGASVLKFPATIQPHQRGQEDSKLGKVETGRAANPRLPPTRKRTVDLEDALKRGTKTALEKGSIAGLERNTGLAVKIREDLPIWY